MKLKRDFYKTDSVNSGFAEMIKLIIVISGEKCVFVYRVLAFVSPSIILDRRIAGYNLEHFLFFLISLIAVAELFLQFSNKQLD